MEQTFDDVKAKFTHNPNFKVKVKTKIRNDILLDPYVVHNVKD